LSEDAEWPWHVGGGTGAVLLSVVMAVVFVLVAQWASKKPE
jgi:hypothetical protein